MNTKETKLSIIQAGHIAIAELVKVAKELIVDSDDDLTADKLKNAAATIKLRKKKLLKDSLKVDLNNVRAKFI